MSKTLKEGKEFITEKILKQENMFKGQEKILNSINENYTKWEGLINDNNLERAEKVGEIIKKDCEKILPTIELIKKVENIDNTLMLYKNKEKYYDSNNYDGSRKQIARPQLFSITFPEFSNYYRCDKSHNIYNCQQRRTKCCNYPQNSKKYFKMKRTFFSVL